MTAYPEPPSRAEYLSTNQSQTPIEEDAPDNVRPELPSTIWPWLISVAAITALSLQTWSLLGLLSAGRNESEFNAKMAAWESANENRQEAIDTWNTIEQHVYKNVDQLRDQSALLRGTIDSLQNQRNRIVESTASQTKALASLQNELEAAREKLDSARQKVQVAELAASMSDAARTQSEKLNADLVERGKKLKAALALLETESSKTEATAETQEKLLRKNQAELEGMQARVNQFDAFLQRKLKTAAEYKLQQEKSAEAAKELESTTEELRTQKAAVAKANGDLDLLKKQLSAQSVTRDNTQSELELIQSAVNTAEAKLVELRKKEQQFVDRIATMTTKLNAAATAASKSLMEINDTAASTIQEMATKAAEVRKAVNQIQVPTEDAPTSPPEETSGADS